MARLICPECEKEYWGEPSAKCYTCKIQLRCAECGCLFTPDAYGIMSCPCDVYNDISMH